MLWSIIIYNNLCYLCDHSLSSTIDIYMVSWVYPMILHFLYRWVWGAGLLKVTKVNGIAGNSTFVFPLLNYSLIPLSYNIFPYSNSRWIGNTHLPFCWKNLDVTDITWLTTRSHHNQKKKKKESPYVLHVHIDLPLWKWPAVWLFKI